MYLVEKHIIDINHPYFKEMDNLCFLAKNLYNKANYYVRQTFIETSKLKEEGKCDTAIYLGYHDIRRIIINDSDYTALPAKVSNQILMKLDKNWKSFFESIKDWKKYPYKYTGKPSLPNYKDKIKGRVGLSYELGAISKKSLKNNEIKLSKTNITVPFINHKSVLKEVRLTIINNVEYKIEIVYEKELKEKVNYEGDHCFGIDLGVDNLMAITSNKEGFTPVLVNGRPMKSVNQFYNKTKAKLTSELPNKSNKELEELKEKYGKETSKQVKNSKRINKLTNKRNGKIEKYFHQSSNYLIDLCLEHEINTIYIGKNKFWKLDINLGKRNNQNFVQLPFNKLIDKIIYKAELNGIKVVLTEESYTSKASFLNMDEVPTYNENDEKGKYEFSGYRKSRGLYKIKGENKLINADINGSYNIIRKVVPNAFADGIEGIAVCPVKVTFDK
jgi:putative transposase